MPSVTGLVVEKLALEMMALTLDGCAKRRRHLEQMDEDERNSAAKVGEDRMIILSAWSVAVRERTGRCSF